MPVNNLIDIGANERITAVFVRPETETDAHYMLMVTKNGYIKKTALAEYANVRRNGLIAINLQEGDELDWVTPTTGSDEILIATEMGKAIRFSETEVRAMGRDTQGVIGIKLGKGDFVVGMATAAPGAICLSSRSGATARGHPSASTRCTTGPGREYSRSRSQIALASWWR